MCRVGAMVLRPVDLGLQRDGSDIKLRIKDGGQEMVVTVPWQEARQFFRAGLEKTVEAERETRT